MQRIPDKDWKKCADKTLKKIAAKAVVEMAAATLLRNKVWHASNKEIEDYQKYQDLNDALVHLIIHATFKSDITSINPI